MISFIQGTILHIKDRSIVIEKQGIGFDIQVPQPALYQIKESTHLFIYMHWNQEQGPTLFGFSSELEKTIFLLVISCSGIGPKIGLALLQQMRPIEFIQAIQTGDEKAISATPGIGTKKAEQMIVQLRHKIEKLSLSDEILSNNKDLEQWKNISEVLHSLNYSRTEVTHALQHIRELEGSFSFDQLLRKALSFLSKQV